MSEERAPYLLQSVDISATLEQARIVSVHDPETGRFLFEYDRERDAIIWYNRSRRIAVPLGQYRKGK